MLDGTARHEDTDTLIACVKRGKHLGKTHVYRRDGSYNKDASRSFRGGTWFHPEESAPMRGLRDLAKTLGELEARGDSLILRAGLNANGLQALALGRPVRKKYKDGAPHELYFREVDRRWLALDYDEEHAPACLDWSDPNTYAAAARAFIAKHCPPWLRGVTCYVQFSSSAGIGGSRVFKVHLWFWLDRAVCSDSLSEWFSAYGLRDTSTLRTVQATYIAPPVFETEADGANTPAPWLDPIPAGHRSFLLEGRRDVAALPPRIVDSATYEALAYQRQRQRDAEAKAEAERRREARKARGLSPLVAGTGDLTIDEARACYAKGTGIPNGGKGGDNYDYKHRVALKHCLGEDGWLIYRDWTASDQARKRWDSAPKRSTRRDPAGWIRKQAGALPDPENPRPTFGDGCTIYLTPELAHQAIAELIPAAVAQGGAHVIAADTGLGKTREAMAYVARTNSTALFVFPTNDLAEEAYRAFLQMPGVRAERVGLGLNRGPKTCRDFTKAMAAESLVKGGASAVCKAYRDAGTPCAHDHESRGNRRVMFITQESLFNTPPKADRFKPLRIRKNEALVIPEGASDDLKRELEVQHAKKVTVLESLYFGRDLKPSIRSATRSLVLEPDAIATAKAQQAKNAGWPDGAPDWTPADAIQNAYNKLGVAVPEDPSDNEELVEAARGVRHFTALHDMIFIDESCFDAMAKPHPISANTLAKFVAQGELNWTNEQLGKASALLARGARMSGAQFFDAVGRGTAELDAEARALTMRKAPEEWSQYGDRNALEALQVAMDGGVSYVGKGEDEGDAPVLWAYILRTNIAAMARTVFVMDATITPAVARWMVGPGAGFHSARCVKPEHLHVTRVPKNLSACGHFCDTKGFRPGVQPALWAATHGAVADDPGVLHLVKKKVAQSAFLAGAGLQGDVIHFGGTLSKGSNKFRECHTVVADSWHTPQHAALVRAEIYRAMAGARPDDFDYQEALAQAKLQLEGAQLLQALARIRPLNATADAPKSIVYHSEDAEPVHPWLVADRVPDPPDWIHERTGLAVAWTPQIIRAGLDMLLGAEGACALAECGEALGGKIISPHCNNIYASWGDNLSRPPALDFLRNDKEARALLEDALQGMSNAAIVAVNDGTAGPPVLCVARVDAAPSDFLAAIPGAKWVQYPGEADRRAIVDVTAGILQAAEQVPYDASLTPAQLRRATADVLAVTDRTLRNRMNAADFATAALHKRWGEFHALPTPKPAKASPLVCTRSRWARPVYVPGRGFLDFGQWVSLPDADVDALLNAHPHLRVDPAEADREREDWRIAHNRGTQRV